MLTAQQLAERVGYIGSSDAPAVLGLSRWSTPLRVWAQKTGQIPIEEFREDLALEVGDELEDLVCRLFTKRTGKQVRRVNETIKHPSYPFIAANIDRRVVGEDAILEAKTAAAWKAKEWAGEDIPQEYIVQTMHQLAVTGKDVAYLACLFGGNQDFRIKTVQRDDQVIADMLKREVRFWRDFVEKKVMPGQISRLDGETLYNLFPIGDEAEELELGQDADEIIERMEAYKADERVLKGHIEREENMLKAILKDRALGKSDKYRVTWKNQSQVRVNSDLLQSSFPEIYSKVAKKIDFRVLRTKSLETKEPATTPKGETNQ